MISYLVGPIEGLAFDQSSPDAVEVLAHVEENEGEKYIKKEGGQAAAPII
jgi:hypothetical protein